MRRNKDVDARDKRGHDAGEGPFLGNCHNRADCRGVVGLCFFGPALHGNYGTKFWVGKPLHYGRNELYFVTSY
jgi:hypothetical protein